MNAQLRMAETQLTLTQKTAQASLAVARVPMPGPRRSQAAGQRSSSKLAYHRVIQDPPALASSRALRSRFALISR